jgi:hypothetical protein
MNKVLTTKKQAKQDIENKFHEIFPNTDFYGECFNKIIDFAVEDILETSALAEGEDYWSDGDISLACKRSLLHFLGHPDY